MRLYLDLGAYVTSCNFWIIAKKILLVLTSNDEGGVSVQTLTMDWPCPDALGCTHSFSDYFRKIIFLRVLSGKWSKVLIPSDRIVDSDYEFCEARESRKPDHAVTSMDSMLNFACCDCRKDYAVGVREENSMLAAPVTPLNAKLEKCGCGEILVCCACDVSET
jgi:hypothetical protein